MLQFILDELHSVSDAKRLEGMKRYAIDTSKAIGVSIPDVRAIAKSVKKAIAFADRHTLAQDLWHTEIHEARIVASIIDNPKEVSKKQMDAWTNDFNSWDLCDQVCNNLFHNIPFYVDMAFEYSHSKKEFVKRTGFVLMVQYTLHHKKESDELCLEFLKRIEAEAWDERNFVQKAVNWCLRQIGKRNLYLNHHAIEFATSIQKQESTSAKWIATDALRELQSEAVMARLKKFKPKK